MKGVNDSAGFWKLVRDFKKKQCLTNISISVKALSDHLKNILMPTVVVNKFYYVLNDELDVLCSMLELSKFLRKVKDNNEITEFLMIFSKMLQTYF